jgi:hypothetical protein
MLASVAAAYAGVKAWKLSREKRAIEEDRALLERIDEVAPKVRALAKAGYTEERRREERRTGNWTTFFASTAQTAGLADHQYRLPAMKTARGRDFLEHYFEIRINPRTGVTRQKIAKFLWPVESRRPYLKVRGLHINRHASDDDWSGTVTIAYREKS